MGQTLKVIMKILLLIQIYRLQQQKMKKYSITINNPRNNSPYSSRVSKTARNIDSIKQLQKSYVTQTYTILLQSSAPLCCLEHGNALSLYCQTQQKLICANCIYSNKKHFNHKVIPLQHSYEKMTRDIDRMSEQVQREIENIDKLHDKIYKRLEDDDSYFNRGLKSIEEMISEIREYINFYEVSIKRKVQQQYQQLNSQSNQLLFESALIKRMFSQRIILEKQRIRNQKTMIYQHCSYDSIISLNRVYNKLLTPENCLVQIIDKQILKLKTFNQTTKKLLTFAKSKSTSSISSMKL